jgi:outer membrane protein OmpA-like peptidoglycan-associated protein
MKSYYHFIRIIFLACLLTEVAAHPAATTDTLTPGVNLATWEAGLQLGAANAYGDLIDSRLIQFKRTRLGYGGFITYHASSKLSLRASYLRASLEGADEDWEALASRGLRFESTLDEVSVVAQWYWGRPAGGASVRPYVFAGLGAGFTEPTTDYSSTIGKPGQEELAAEDMANVKTSHMLVPLGLGAKIELSEHLLLGVEYGLRPVFNDYLDGVSALGNPDRNDWYSMATASLSYRFGQRDQDADGIVDREDSCPTEWGLPQHEGCPDTDADGLANHLDQCPELAGPQGAGGCPDQDEDGIPDREDDCPYSPGAASANGCPDTDGDGVPDSEDQCVTIAGSAKFKGCRDTDEDGVPDPEDRCPYEKGEPAKQGCPAASTTAAPDGDRDGDGVRDEEDDCPTVPGSVELKGCRDTDEDGVADPDDRCPYQKGTAANQGCPPETEESVEPVDSDGDGLLDEEDDCPLVAGPVSRGGCPEMSTAEEEVLRTAMDNISFHQGSYRLISTSYPTLDEIAALLKQYPSYHLQVEGHTDNQGDPAANKRLSERRAQVCLDYLHEEGGIARERMTAIGYGSERPRSTNESESGRRRNRRVEFRLFEPGDE